MSGERVEAVPSGQTQGSTCPFCGAGWTARMVEAFDRMILPGGCACCAPGTAGLQAEHEAHEPVPVADLECDSCGRAIYRAPDSLTA